MSSGLDPSLLAEAEDRLAAIRSRIERACATAGRNPAEVSLVGACKRQPADRIAALVCAGLSELGENYVQSAITTQAELGAHLRDHFGEASAPTPRWRMIGHLQRNKAAQAVETFGAVDSVDSARLARALATRAREAGTVLDICLQVNLSGEKSKSGCAEEEVGGLFAACAELSELRVVGLMTLPAPGSGPEDARPAFARLRALRDTLSREPGGADLHHLNMGMSRDLEIAIEEGSTLVRVGTDLFGERPTGDRNAEPSTI